MISRPVGTTWWDSVSNLTSIKRYIQWSFTYHLACFVFSDSVLLWLAWNSQYRPGGSQTHWPPWTAACPVLGLQVYITTPSPEQYLFKSLYFSLMPSYSFISFFINWFHQKFALLQYFQKHNFKLGNIIYCTFFLDVFTSFIFFYSL